MTQIDVEKAVAYGVEQPPVALEANKVAVYGVEMPTRAIEAEKTVLYAVEMVPLFLELEKTTLYGVEKPDASGSATQGTASSRPIYRAGPKPYVEFGTGQSLNVFIIVPGIYTIVLFKPDQTFTVTQTTLSTGQYALTENFNQCVIYQGIPSRQLLRRIKATMIGRANP